MDTIFSSIQKNKKVYTNTFRILVILAIGFLAAGNTHAQSESPWMIAFPENDAVEGWEWPDGATVTLTIDNAPGLSWSGTAAVTTWGDPRTFLRIDFWEEYDLQVGDMVTLTDEFGTSTSHKVQPLSIISVDMKNDIVAGTANNDAFLQVWVHEQSVPPAEPTIINEYWEADLSGVFDITYDTGGRAWVISKGGNATAVDWHVPNPRFVVFPEWEFFDGLDWPNEAIVSISVEGKPECSLERESWGYFFNGNFPEGCDIQAGDTVTFDDGTTIREHIVRNLYVTDVDTVENTVTGKADEGETVYVWPHDGWFEPLQAIVGEPGEWQVDLDDAGYTIRDDSIGRSEIRDEMGNATANDWHVTHPHFTVFPEWEFFDGLDWPNEAIVSISVEGKPECSLVRESWGYFFNGNFPESCDIQAGDTVTFDDGATNREHLVRNLAITKVNEEDNIIKGVADAGAEIHVWPHATGQEQLALTNPKGKWNVDFTGTYDLMTGDAGRAEIRDEFGNATAVDWFVSQPRFTIYPDAQWFDGIDWPDGATVTITVKDKPECSFTRESWGGFFNGGFPEGCVIAARDKVTFTDGFIKSKHTVQNLAISMVDKEAGIVYGTADSGAVIHTWIWNSDGSTLEGSNLDVIAVDDMWQVDFWALEIDLEVGMGIQAEIRDEKGNATSVDLPVPNPPRLAAYLEQEFVIGWDWPQNAVVTMTINDPTTGPDVDIVRATQVVKTPFSPDIWWALFQLEGEYDLKPGDIVLLTDGDTTREHEVLPLTVDTIDANTDTVAGTSASGAWVYVHPWEVTFDPVQASHEGNWLMSFAGIYDLQGGTNGIAEVFDNDGDSTAIDWQVLPSYIFAHPAYELIEGVGWIPGTDVMVTVDDPTNGEGVDYSNNQIVGDDGWLHLWLTGFDLQAGHIIKMTDGRNPRMMVVSSLRVTGFNLDAHTVYGIGDPDSEFFIADNGMPVLINGDGNWSATFEELIPGSWWTIIHPDLYGNEVRETFRAPMPAMIAWKNWDDVAGSEWTPGAEVTLTIDDPTNGEDVDYTFYQDVVQNGPLYYGDVYFDLGIELQTGYILTMSDGSFTKTLVISALTVTGFDFENHIISGTGDPGAYLFVHMNGLDSDWITVGEDHNWSVYHELLEPGVWFDSIQPDEDGDQTRDGGQAW